MFSNNVPNRTHVQTVPGFVVVGLFPIYSVYKSEIPVTFLMTMTKYLANRNWRKGGFFWLTVWRGSISPQENGNVILRTCRCLILSFVVWAVGQISRLLPAVEVALCYQDQNKQTLGRNLSSRWKWPYQLLDAKFIVVISMVFTSLCTVPCPSAWPPTSCATCSQDSFS